MVRKSIGGETPCPWGKLVKVPWTALRFEFIKATYYSRLTLRETDTALDIQRFDSPARPFWIKRGGESLDGRNLLAFVLAEQEWISANAPADVVRPGDVVVDIGAHIGSFGDDALHRGASKVIMVEPDPVNVECIRRNFRNEIAEGRVIVVPEGAWSSLSTLEFHTGVANSGTGSFVVNQDGSQKILVKVRPLDDILRDWQISRVDYIKMDIEGAEREALKGAVQTLRNHKPRLMLDSYHLADDSVVIPRMVYGANGGYQQYCAICSSSEGRIAPYAIFFH